MIRHLTALNSLAQRCHQLAAQHPDLHDIATHLGDLVDELTWTHTNLERESA